MPGIGASAPTWWPSAYALLLLLSVLVHELAHALTAKIFRWPTAQDCAQSVGRPHPVRQLQRHPGPVAGGGDGRTRGELRPGRARFAGPAAVPRRADPASPAADQHLRLGELPGGGLQRPAGPAAGRRPAGRIRGLEAAPAARRRAPSPPAGPAGSSWSLLARRLHRAAAAARRQAGPAADDRHRAGRRLPLDGRQRRRSSTPALRLRLPSVSAGASSCAGPAVACRHRHASRRSSSCARAGPDPRGAGRRRPAARSRGRRRRAGQPCPPSAPHRPRPQPSPAPWRRAPYVPEVAGPGAGRSTWPGWPAANTRSSTAAAASPGCCARGPSVRRHHGQDGPA